MITRNTCIPPAGYNLAAILLAQPTRQTLHQYLPAVLMAVMDAMALIATQAPMLSRTTIKT